MLNKERDLTGRGFFESRERGSEQLVSEIAPIEESGGEMLVRKEDIKRFIEKPLVSACELLWDKNIRTLSTSANWKDLDRCIEKEDYKEGGPEQLEAYIILDIETMSEKNREIALQEGDLYGKYGGVSETVKIVIPINEQSTAEEIKEKAEKIVEKFEKQEAEWVPVFSPEYLMAAYNLKESDDYNKEIEGEGYYIDPKDPKKIYLSEEHYRKAQEGV